MRTLLELGGVQARSGYARLGGGRIHYLEAGEGPPVVLLQGAGGGGANWYRLMAPLARAARVVAPDLPGFGLSDRMPVRDPLGEGVAALIEEWLASIGIARAMFVATSFGSLIALRLAARERSPVERLALLNGVGLGREIPLPVRLAGVPLVGPAGLRPSRGGTRWQLRALLTRPRWRLPHEHEDALVEYLRASAAAGDTRWLSDVIRRFCGLRGQHELLTRGELGRIDAPTLVVWGALDPFLPPAHGARAAALIPHAVLHVLPRTGHSPNWENPGGVLRVLEPFVRA